MQFIFRDFAVSTLAGSIAAGDTTLTVQAGAGSQFPNPGANQVFAGVLASAGTPNAPPFEVVWCSSRTGDTCTVIRGRELSTAQNWPAGSIFSHRITAGVLNQLGVSGANTQEYDSGAPVTITNNAAGPFTYTNLQTVSFTFPTNSITNKYLLFIDSIVNCGANPGADPIDYGQVLTRVRDVTDMIDLIAPAGQVTISSTVGATFDIPRSAFASSSPGGGAGDKTLLFDAGSTITLKQAVALANTGAFPIPSAVVSGILICTAVPNC